MIIFGVILLIIGFVAGIAIIWTIGIIVVVIGAILALWGWPVTRSADAGTTSSRWPEPGPYRSGRDGVPMISAQAEVPANATLKLPSRSAWSRHHRRRGCHGRALWNILQAFGWSPVSQP